MKTAKILSLILTIVLMLGLTFAFSATAFAATEEAEIQTTEAAEQETADSSTGAKAIAAAIVVGLASAVGALGMGIAIAKSTESMARQPEASGKINSAMMLGMVFIETLIIYALIVAILIIFVL